MKVLVDTSVIIDYLRRKDRLGSLFIFVRERYQMVVSFATVTELYSGTSSQDKATIELIEEIVTSCEIKFIDDYGAREAGRLRRDYRMSLGDCLVAEVAIREGLQLVTLDKKAFAKIAGLKLWETP